MLAAGIVNTANRTGTAKNAPASRIGFTTAATLRATTTPIAKNTNAASGHAQRNGCDWNVPNTVSGNLAAVTTPSNSATPATASAQNETVSPPRIATNAHAPSTTANATSATSAAVSDGASHPGLKVSLKDGRNHNGGSATTLAT